MTERRFLTVKEFGETVAVSDCCVRAMVKRGEIRAVKLGGSIRIPVSELERLESDAADRITERTATAVASPRRADRAHKQAKREGLL